MGTILASSIIDDIELILFDETNDRWDETAEHLTAINNCSRDIVGKKPEENISTVEILLVTGTRQTLTSGMIRLSDVSRNMGVGGGVPGKSITLVSMTDLDNFDPDWNTNTASDEAVHYMYDPDNPKTFYIYPPQPAIPGSVEISVQNTPVDIAIIDPIPLDDIFKNCYVNFGLYSAYRKSSAAQDLPRSQYYYSRYLQDLMIKEVGEKEIEANYDADK